MMRPLRSFYVSSPDYTTGGYIGDPPEPPEYGADCVEVRAHTKREAIVLGVRLMRKQRRSWAEENISDGRPPWEGIRAEEAICEHGVVHFILVAGKAVEVRCPACDTERRAEEVSA